MTNEGNPKQCDRIGRNFATFFTNICRTIHFMRKRGWSFCRFCKVNRTPVFKYWTKLGIFSKTIRSLWSEIETTILVAALKKIRLSRCKIDCHSKWLELHSTSTRFYRSGTLFTRFIFNIFNLMTIYFFQCNFSGNSNAEDPPAQHVFVPPPPPPSTAGASFMLPHLVPILWIRFCRKVLGHFNFLNFRQNKIEHTKIDLAILDEMLVFLKAPKATIFFVSVNYVRN
jgi:hypothetical protein